MSGHQALSMKDAGEGDPLLAAMSPDWRRLYSEVVEDLRSMALHCRGLACVAINEEQSEALLRAAEDYDQAADGLLRKAPALN